MYKRNMQKEILNTVNLDVLEDSVEDLTIECTSKHPSRKVVGVYLGTYMHTSLLDGCHVYSSTINQLQPAKGQYPKVCLWLAHWFK